MDTNRDHAILCVLSKLNPNRSEAVLNYSSPDGLSISGIQSNEAAVKYLLEKALQDGNPIKEIDYLLSSECCKKDIPSNIIPQEYMIESDGVLCSTESFFQAQVLSYCKERDISTPTFNPISYDPKNPTDCLETLIQFFSSNDFRISIDTTGGPRDAAVLLTFAIEVIKLRSRQNELGPIVYAYMDSATNSGIISRQDYTYNLIDLIHAVRAFTDYGRANGLRSFFSSEEAISAEAHNLCMKMEEFSNSLALCQVNDIEQTVRNIHKSMDEFIKATDKRKAALEDVLETNSEADSNGIAKSQNENAIARGELLFASLVPTLKEEFIPECANASALLIEIIRWCATHQMVQQALCIYRERISEILLDMGYFELTKNSPYHYELVKGEMQPEKADASIKSIIDRCWQDSENGIIPNPNYDYFSVRDDGVLRLEVLHYGYLRGIRNRVMHLDATYDNKLYKMACRHFKKKPNKPLLLTDIQQALLDAMDCILKNAEVDGASWNKLFKQKQHSGKRHGKGKGHARY